MSVFEYQPIQESAGEEKAKRLAASLAENVNGTLGLDKVHLSGVMIATCFAGDLTDGDAYFPHYVVDCYLTIIER